MILTWYINSTIINKLWFKKIWFINAQEKKKKCSAQNTLELNAKPVHF